MNDKELTQIAHRILHRAGLEDNKEFGSVIAILMIVSIIVSLIRVMQECNKQKTATLKFREKCDIYGAQMKLLAHKRGWFTKLRIKKILRRELSKEDYAKYSTRLIEAILDTGENLTQDEIITLLEAANV